MRKSPEARGAGRGETAAGRMVISVGPAVNPQEPDGAWSLDDLGAEGYLIRSAREGQNHELVVAGATPKGTRNGLQTLMRMIRAEGTSAYLAADVNVASKPAFAVRGLHFNGWMFNSPYSFRTWTEAEWKSYIDTLGCQHVNLLYLWPFMEIIPLPLSPEDTAYLEEVRRVVQYAQDAHGMEVWIMQAANRVAKHNAGVADPRFRPYWLAEVQTDRDPGDPEEFKAIMASHAALYEIVNNVDGVCTIDTDPGSYPGSTLEEYTAILKGCRELLDQYNVHGRQAKLIHWMWLGWGGEERREELSWQRQTVEALQAQVPEPWWLVAGQEIYLPVIQEANALGKTVFLRYGTIESEPSYPLTQEPAYVLGEIDKMFGFAREYPGLLGVMGNTQCPILQGVGIYHHLLCSWDMGRLDLSEREVLREFAELLYPERKELIADAFEGLNWNGSHQPIERLIAELDQAVAEDRLGRPGVIGRKLFPTHQIMAESLLLQLRLKAALQRLYAELQRTSSREECFRLMEDCLDAHLAWHSAHGWHKLWGSERAALGRFRQDDRFRASLRRLHSVLGTDESVQAFFAEMAERLAAKHGHESAVADATGPTMQALLREVGHEPSLASEGT